MKATTTRIARTVMGRYILLALLASSLACSGTQDSPSQANAPSPPSGGAAWTQGASYRFKVYAGSPGATRLLEVPPLPTRGQEPPTSRTSASTSLWHFEASDTAGPLGLPAPLKPVAGSGPSTTAPGAQLSGVIETPTGPLELPNTNDLTNGLPWALLMGAAAECGGTLHADGNDSGPGHPVAPPWSLPFQDFIFLGPADSCEMLLWEQQATLCIADKLAEVADAVAPIHWDQVPAAVWSGPWTIPPQAEKDKFIARDMAIYALANLAYLDQAFPYRAGAPLNWCGQWYGFCAVDSQFAFDNVGIVFGQNPPQAFPFEQDGPPDPYTAADSTKFLRASNARLMAKTMILRQGARLMEELINKSVDSDLAGAADARQTATDTIAGQARAWGVDGNPDGDFNSLSHAVRLLQGRLERLPAPYQGLVKADPQCSGVPAASLLKAAYGPDLSARYGMRQIENSAQRSAQEVLDASGVILPKSALAQPITTVRASVKDALKVQRAMELGYAPTNTSFPGAEVLDSVIDGIADADLKFALEQNFRSYRLLAAADEQAPIAPEGVAGLKVFNDASGNPYASLVAQLQGIKLKDGIPRHDMASPVLSHVAGIQEASACAEPGGITAVGYTGYSFARPFQDPFSSVQFMRERLILLREIATGLPQSPSPDQDVARTAAFAAAEIRTWAGPGQMAVYTGKVSRTAEAETLNVFIKGFIPKDFGASSTAEMVKKLVLVYGEPWVADCAAGLRENCPADFDLHYVMRPNAGDALVTDLREDTAQASSSRMLTGTDGVIAFIPYTVLSGVQEPINFRPELHGPTVYGKHLYAVVRGDGRDPSGKGRVIGTLVLRPALPEAALDEMQTSGAAQTPVSYLQQSLLEKVLGTSKTAFSAEICGPSPAHSNQPCVADADYEMFVALENELTSDSDQYENSWRHYLQAAKQAAAHADELGKELIDAGTKKDMTREAASEQLGDECGTYASLADVLGDSLDVSAPESNSAARACTDEPRVDLLFLAEDPFPAKWHGSDDKLSAAMLAERDSYIHDHVLKCKSPADHAVDSALCAGGSGKDGHYTYATMGLAPSNVVASDSDCGKLGLDKFVQSLAYPSGLDGATAMALTKRPGMAADRLSQNLSQVTMKVDKTGNWQLLANLSPIMDSNVNADGVWPGCRNGDAVNGKTCCKPGLQECDLSAIQQLERAFAPEVYGDPIDESTMKTIRWRIEGALWTLASLANVAHEGLYDTYVPVRDWAWSPNVPGVIPAIYSVAGFDPNSGVLLGQDGNISEWNKVIDGVGATEVMPSGWVGGAWAEIPPALQDLYLDNKTLYRNKSTRSSQPGLYSEANLSQSRFESAIQKLTGARCTGPSGDAFNEPSKQAQFHDGRVSLGALRTLTFSPYICAAMKPLPYGFVLGVTPSADANSVMTVLTDTWMGVYGAGDGPATLSEVVYNGGELTDATGRWGTLVDPFLPASQGGGPEGEDEPWLAYLHPYAGYTNPGLGCRPLQDSPAKFTLLRRDCVQKASIGTVNFPGLANDFETVTRRVLSPMSCAPSDRLRLFVNSYPPADTCVAAAQVTQALALSCMFEAIDMVPKVDQPPTLTDASQIPQLVGWLRTVGSTFSSALGHYYLESVPKRVVIDDATSNTVSGALSGRHGQLVASLREDLLGIRSGWDQAGSALRVTASEIQSAHAQITQANLLADEKAKSIALSQISVHQHVDQAYSSAAAGCSPSFGGEVVNWNPGNCLGSLYYLQSVRGSLQEQIGLLQQQKADADGGKHAAIEQILSALQGSVEKQLSGAKESFSHVQASAVSAISKLAEIRDSERKAKYLLAKGSGADFLLDPVTGKPVALPLNVVQNRQYAIAKIRYEEALKNAKYLAYVARRAIEQRLGLRLECMTEKVGPYAAPAEWADKVCSLSGIDYAKLRNPYSNGLTSPTASEGEADGGVPPSSVATDVINNFADQYIGDYVTKLENFVEYYNIDFPSHDGDDVAVLSLRDDLLSNGQLCSVEASNLLLYSGALDRSDWITGAAGEVELRGWTVPKACDAWGVCVQVTGGDSVAPGLNGSYQSPSGASRRNFTLLSEYDQASAGAAGSGGSQGGGSGGSGGNSGANGASGGAAGSAQADSKMPPRGVAQDVVLDVGTYVLSWWDQERALDGSVPAAGAALPPSYKVEIYDENWKVLKAWAFQPHRPDATSEWSERISRAFEVTKAQEYHVMFSPSSSSERAAVLVGAVQLEKTAVGGAATAYQETGSTRLIFTPTCAAARTAADVQKAFIYTCSEGPCRYVLPITVDTSVLQKGASALNEKIAQGNFNYRHVSTAVNMVGTDVHDCTASGAQACYGSGYLEYSLQHDAHQAGVLNYKGERQIFSFGTARINHAKALASEKYVTNPVSSADQALLNQASIQKSELRGRPLDGQYELTIWDSPDLRWDHLEDVQIVLTYRYWSNIDK